MCVNIYIYIYICKYVNIYIYIHIYIYICNGTMHPFGYHYDGFVATHAFGHMMYGLPYIICSSP